MNTENLKGLIASELIIVAREEKDKRPTELNFEELIDVTDSIVKKLILYGVVGRSEQLKPKQQICYKSNEPCKYDCTGLCKESC